MAKRYVEITRERGKAPVVKTPDGQIRDYSKAPESGSQAAEAMAINERRKVERQIEMAKYGKTGETTPEEYAEVRKLAEEKISPTKTAVFSNVEKATVTTITTTGPKKIQPEIEQRRKTQIINMGKESISGQPISYVTNIQTGEGYSMPLETLAPPQKPKMGLFSEVSPLGRATKEIEIGKLKGRAMEVEKEYAGNIKPEIDKIQETEKSLIDDKKELDARYKRLQERANKPITSETQLNMLQADIDRYNIDQDRHNENVIKLDERKEKVSAFVQKAKGVSYAIKIFDIESKKQPDIAKYIIEKEAYEKQEQLRLERQRGFINWESVDLLKKGDIMGAAAYGVKNIGKQGEFFINRIQETTGVNKLPEANTWGGRLTRSVITLEAQKKAYQFIQQNPESVRNTAMAIAFTVSTAGAGGLAYTSKIPQIGRVVLTTAKGIIATKAAYGSVVPLTEGTINIAQNVNAEQIRSDINIGSMGVAEYYQVKPSKSIIPTVSQLKYSASIDAPFISTGVNVYSNVFGQGKIKSEFTQKIESDLISQGVSETEAKARAKRAYNRLLIRQGEEAIATVPYNALTEIQGGLLATSLKGFAKAESGQAGALAFKTAIKLGGQAAALAPVEVVGQLETYKYTRGIDYGIKDVAMQTLQTLPITFGFGAAIPGLALAGKNVKSKILLGAVYAADVSEATGDATAAALRKLKLVSGLEPTGTIKDKVLTLGVTPVEIPETSKTTGKKTNVRNLVFNPTDVFESTSTEKITNKRQINILNNINIQQNTTLKGSNILSNNYNFLNIPLNVNIPTPTTTPVTTPTTTPITIPTVVTTGGFMPPLPFTLPGESSKAIAGKGRQAYVDELSIAGSLLRGFGLGQRQRPIKKESKKKTNNKKPKFKAADLWR